MKLSFTVFGAPVPKARARVMRGFSFTPKRTKDYEALVKAAAIEAMATCPHWVRDNAAGYRVSVAVYRNALRGDLDNFTKSALDAANKLVFDDDRRVTEIHAVMLLDRVCPRMLIEVEALS